MYECVYVIYVDTFLRAAYPVVVRISTSNRRRCRGGPIARPPKSPNLKLPDICVWCVQNTFHGNAKMTSCCDFDTSHTGSRKESIHIRYMCSPYKVVKFWHFVFLQCFAFIHAQMGHISSMLFAQPIQNFRKKAWKEGTAWMSWVLEDVSCFWQKDPNIVEFN